VKLGLYQHFISFSIKIERNKGLKRKNKRKGLEARARRGIHHLGAKLRLGLEILGARGKRVRLHS
jgi:hypothetical protein